MVGGESSGGTGPGGRVHPRTRVGGGARWIQVLFEGGRRKLACGLPNEKRTQETMGGAGMQGAAGDRMEFLRRQLPPAEGVEGSFGARPVLR